MPQLKKMMALVMGVLTGASLITGCVSSQIRARKEVREKTAQSSHLYCDFVNGETFPDVDVELNIEMGKRCDTAKSMTITSYRSPSDAIGLVYCCNLREDAKFEKEKR